MACVNLWPWERFGSFVCNEMTRNSVYWSVAGTRVVAGWLSESGLSPSARGTGLTHTLGVCISTRSTVTRLPLITVSGGGDKFHSLLLLSHLLPLLPSNRKGKPCRGIPLWSRGGQNKRRPVFRRPLLRLQRMWKQ